MLRPRPHRHALALALALAALPACAASSKAPAAAAPDERLPADVDGALARLDQAEAELSLVIGPARLDAMARAQPAPEEAAAPPPPPAPAPAPMAPPPTSHAEDSAARKDKEDERPVRGRGSPCATACQALTSMRRAADHLCGLAGESDARCGSARERVERAGERVQGACPACDE